MKKNYQKPALQVERVATTHTILSLSTIVDGDGNYKPADGSECFTGEEKPSTNVWGEEW